LREAFKLKQSFKRLAAVVLIFAFGVCCFIQTADAQTDVPISQEKAVQMAKSIFDTSIYDRFTINYSEGREQKTWHLNWTMSKEPYGNLSIAIDSEKGRIVNIYLYKGHDPNRKPLLIPKVSEVDARKAAEDFARKLQPEEFSKTLFREIEEPYYPFEPIRYRDTYDFNFVRIENDIPVENDGFNISVDVNNGDIQNYNFSWSSDELPSPDKIISKQEAEQIFTDKVGLQLVYQRYFDYVSKEDKVKLVYTINRPYRIRIDAISGELLDETDYYDEMSLGAGSREKAFMDAQNELTPEELREVEATKNCIPKDAAIKIVSKYLKIPENYNQRHGSLNEDYDTPGRKIWNISWIKKTESDDSYGSINAQVDAISSELLNFNIYDDSMQQKDFKQNFDRSAAQEKAEQFLKEIQPERFKSIKLEEPKGKIIYPDKIRTHYFSYLRQVNDIPYTANGFAVAVDGENGKIVSYDMRWHDKEFVKPEDAIAKDDANTRVLVNPGLELSYVRIYNNKDDSYKYHLVYKPAQSPSFTFDAFDFTPLDHQGNPIKKKSHTSFSDIQDHWAEKDIRLLVNLGIISSKQDTFKPNENINQGKFIKLLLISTNNVPESSGLSFDFDDDDVQKYVDKAIRLGIVKKGEINADKPLSREKMAAFVVRALDFDKVASISNIYIVPAKDAVSINSEYKGHVAVAIGLRLVTGESGNYNPKGNVSRAQSAAVIARMLKLEK
jgi:hypothetical protein